MVTLLESEGPQSRYIRPCMPVPLGNRQEWITAVEMAARQLIADGYTDLVGPALERRADWIYQEEILGSDERQANGT